MNPAANFVVVFRATARDLDAEYSTTAAYLRDRALSEFGCLEFEAVNENGKEVALSYWANLDDIQRWKALAEHLQAQAKGRSLWYESYSVEIAQIVRRYEHIS